MLINSLVHVTVLLSDLNIGNPGEMEAKVRGGGIQCLYTRCGRMAVSIRQSMPSWLFCHMPPMSYLS